MRKGWETKELSEVSAINYGYTESAASEPIGPRFLRITDIQDDRVNWDSVPYCKIEAHELPKYRLAKGDIVFARTGATTGKSFLVDDLPEAVFASYLIRLRLLDKKLLPEFVSLFFQTSGYWKSIKEGSAGSAQGGFNATKLGALSIPVPPLAEQQRIVGVLDEAFAGLATAQANAEKNLQNARALFESHLQSVFTQRVKGWAVKTLESCCEQIFAGGDVPKDRLSQERTEKFCVPIYSNGEKNDGLYGFTDAARVTKPSITVSARGTLGFTAIRTEPFLPVVRLIVLVPDEKQTMLSFLYYALLGMKFGNTGTSIPQLTVPNFKESQVNVPSLSEQEAIVAQLDTLTAETQRLENLYQQKLAALAALKKSLLHQAFSGQL
ncbi:MAG: restriction endonuclease subunit S [Arenimonas sp.]